MESIFCYFYIAYWLHLAESCFFVFTLYGPVAWITLILLLLHCIWLAPSLNYYTVTVFILLILQWIFLTDCNFLFLLLLHTHFLLLSDTLFRCFQITRSSHPTESCFFWLLIACDLYLGESYWLWLVLCKFFPFYVARNLRNSGYAVLWLHLAHALLLAKSFFYCFYVAYGWNICQSCFCCFCIAFDSHFKIFCFCCFCVICGFTLHYNYFASLPKVSSCIL